MNHCYYSLANADEAVAALFESEDVRALLPSSIRVAGALIATYFKLYVQQGNFHLEFYNEDMRRVKHYRLKSHDEKDWSEYVLDNFGLPVNPETQTDVTTVGDEQFPMGRFIHLIKKISRGNDHVASLEYALYSFCLIVMGEEYRVKSANECIQCVLNLFALGGLEHYDFETTANGNGFVFTIKQHGTFVGQIVFLASKDQNEEFVLIPDKKAIELDPTKFVWGRQFLYDFRTMSELLEFKACKAL